MNDLLTYVQANFDGWDTKEVTDLEEILSNMYSGTTNEEAAETFYTDFGNSWGLSPNQFFNSAEYKLAAEAQRDTWAQQQFDENKFFSLEMAQAAYDAQIDANPYQHYLQVGAALGVNPSNSFDESDFLQEVIDGMELDMTVEELRALASSAGLTALDFYVDYIAPDEELVALYPAPPVPEEEQVGTTPVQAFELSGAATVDEGGTLTVTVTATEAVAEDTTFTYSLAGSGDAPYAADPDDFSTATSGTVKILAGDTTGTFTVGIAKNDGAEYDQDFTVTLKSDTEDIDILTATINDTSTNDNTAPVATAAVVHYNENATATTVLATVAATDPTNGDTGVTGSGVTGFEIVSGDSTTAPNFAIDATGKITFTTAGLTSTYNDADDTGAAALNTVTLGVKAVDAAGNKSETVNIQLDVDNVDDTPPTVQSAVITGNTVVVNFGESLDTASGSPVTTDFKVNVAQNGGTGVNNVTAILVGTNSVTLTLANPAATGQTFTLDYTPGTTPLQDAAGNDVVAFTGQAVKADTTAPVITAGQTASYIEGTNDDIADIVYTVAATDADSSVASFSIESGNTSGFYAIDNKGNITLTTAGLASTAASNDFETTPNSFTLGVKATDAAGNSATQNVVINITNNAADDAATPMELAFKIGTSAEEGASGNDTFTGDSNTIDAGDVIDGNDGTDTARVYLDTASETFTSREVEIMEVQGTGTAAASGVPITRTLTASNFTGVTTITNNASSFLPFTDATAANGTLTIWDVPNLVTVGFKGGDGTDNYTVNFRSGVTTGELSVTADGGSIRNLMVGDSTGAQEFTSIKINSTGTTSNGINDILDGAGNAANNMTKLTVIGDKYLGITQALENVTTIDASGASGGLGVVIDPTVGVNVKFTGSTGNDSVNIGSTGLSSSDVLAGGTGTDTLIVNNINAQLTAVNSANIKEFDTLNVVATGAGTLAGVQAAEAVTIDIDNIVTNNALTGITISGGSLTGITDVGNDVDAFTDLADTITINNINSGAVNNVTITLTDDTGDTAVLLDTGANNDTTTAQTDNLTFTGKGFLPGGTSDTATLDFNNLGSGGAPRDASGIDVNTLTFNNLDVLNIKSTGDATPAGAEQASIASLDASDTEKIVITGTQSFSLVTAATTNAITEIDASGLTGTTAGAYGLTLNTSAATSITSLLVKGTGDADAINVSSEGAASSLLTGAGNDVVTIDEGSTSTMHFTTATMASGDMTAGTTILVNGLLSPNDFILNLASGVEGVLKSATTVLGTAASNVNLASTIDANSNVAFFDATDGDADGAADDFIVRIDLNGDGSFVAATDWQLVVVNGAATLAGVTYNAANDVFGFTGLNAVNGTGGADAALGGTAAADVITGNAGADIITGGDSADFINGGTGADTFVITDDDAVDTITDFTAAAGGDVLMIDFGDIQTAEGNVLKDGNSAAINAATAMSVKAVAGATNAAAGDEIFVITAATYATSALMEVAIENAGAAAITLAAASTIGDDYMVLWTDGTNGHLGLMNAVGAAVTLGAGSTYTELVTLTGIATTVALGTFVNANFGIQA